MGNEAHIRIDEGVKRPPRNRTPRPLRKNEKGQVEAIPADLDPRTVLQRYLAADTSSQVARELGIRRSSLTRWMRESLPDEWRAVQIVRAHLRKEDGEDGIYGARDALELARARELLNSARWELQALDKEYVPKQDVTIENVGDLGGRLRRSKERVIEGEVVANTPNAALQSPVSDISTGKD